MRVIITGGTGLIGRALAQSLAADGHEVIVLSRSPQQKQDRLPAGVRVVQWDGRTAQGWGDLANGADAIVNLAGESIGGTSFPPPRWTAARKQRILQSRLNAGAAVVEAVRNAKQKPRVVIQSSGVGYYGDGGDTLLSENSPAGSDFAARVCVDWEQATAPVEALGVRRVVMRTAVVLDMQNAAFNSLVLQSRLFAGGPLGSGRQYFAWIHRDDMVRAIRFFIENPETSGVYNVGAPSPVTNREAIRALGRILRRPAFLGVPAFALRLLLGEVSDVVLYGQRVSAARLQEAGFSFQYTDFEAAARSLLGK